MGEMHNAVLGGSPQSAA